MSQLHLYMSTSKAIISNKKDATIESNTEPQLPFYLTVFSVLHYYY